MSKLPADLGKPKAQQRAVGYYGLPVIHEPHWKWLIIGYFFFGGVSGSSAFIAAVARLIGGKNAAGVARIGTYVATAALAPCPVFLILDLGRPARFLNMLRTFQPSSPMSAGTWGLSAFGVVTAVATLLQVADDRSTAARSQARPIEAFLVRGTAVLSGATGLFVAGYTGVLLAATAVPLWSKRPAMLGPLFLSSAMTSGLATISAVAALSYPEDDLANDAVHRLEALSTIAEGSLLAAWLIALGPTARPLFQGQVGYVVRRAVVGAGMTAPLAISAVSPWLPCRARRAASVLASALTLVGVFALRFAVVEGGRQSARDPHATFEMTG